MGCLFAPKPLYRPQVHSSAMWWGGDSEVGGLSQFADQSLLCLGSPFTSWPHWGLRWFKEHLDKANRYKNELMWGKASVCRTVFNLYLWSMRGGWETSGREGHFVKKVMEEAHSWVQTNQGLEKKLNPSESEFCILMRPSNRKKTYNAIYAMQ